MKIVVIGGVAGGASAAAKARRVDESAEIVLFERGEYISFANCGLPYHLGKVIPQRESLLVMTPKLLADRTGIEVRTLSEVTAINRRAKTVTVHNTNTGETYEESYDKLIISTGSSPIRPPVPGADDMDVMQLWTIPDMDRINARINEGARKAVVIGGGFIGLEVVENLVERGLQVELVEMMEQVLPTIDREMAQALAEELTGMGVVLHLGRKAVEIERHSEIHTASFDQERASEYNLSVALDDGSRLDADFVVMSVGVRPNSELAKSAGLKLTERGGIEVNEYLETSDADIYAVGDVISVRNLITNEAAMIPLAGPANRQGRIAAVNACGGRLPYQGSLGTAVVKVGKLTAAGAGLTESRLRQSKLDFRKVYFHGASHASYYPGALPLAIKLLFDQKGRLLGAQVVGGDGVDKRIDVLATAMKHGLTVYDLEDLELAYAPPYGSAKDPVNFAGMVAANVLRGESTAVSPEEIPADAWLLDVREPAETDLGTIGAAKLIPLGSLRSRLGELPKDRRIIVYCKAGLRGYLAERILVQNGFQAANLSGGWLTWKAFNPSPLTPPPPSVPPAKAPSCGAVAGLGSCTKTIDVSALQCPGPVVRVREEIAALGTGETLAIRAMAGFAPDLRAWCEATGNQLLHISEPGGGQVEATVKKVAAAKAAGAGAGLQPQARPESAAIVIFSNDLDKVLAGFIIATGLAAMGVKVSMFFTFWGLTALRRERPPATAKDLLSRMFGLMLPKGPRKLALSKMHMMGMGTAMMKHVMKSKNVNSLPAMIQEARKLGIRFIACEMAMNVMGLSRQELEEVDEVAGVAKFAALAKDSGTTLFI